MMARIQRKPRGENKLFTHCSLEKGLIPNIHKTLVELYKKKIHNTIKKGDWAFEMNKIFSKKRYSIQKAQIKALFH